MELSELLSASYQPPNTALQTDNNNLSCLLHSQKSRQFAVAAELGRYMAPRQ